MNEVLIIAIGNDARGDDGLGWNFADRIAKEDFTRIEFRYQLQIEDAELIAQYQCVLFVDACVEPCAGGFSFEPVAPSGGSEVSTHRLPPDAVVSLARVLYGARPNARLLRIDGENFELGEPLSATARRNLESAVEAWQSERRHLKPEDAFAQDP